MLLGRRQPLHSHTSAVEYSMCLATSALTQQGHCALLTGLNIQGSAGNGMAGQLNRLVSNLNVASTHLGFVCVGLLLLATACQLLHQCSRLWRLVLVGCGRLYLLRHQRADWNAVAGVSCIAGAQRPQLCHVGVHRGSNEAAGPNVRTAAHLVSLGEHLQPAHSAQCMHIFETGRDVMH